MLDDSKPYRQIPSKRAGISLLLSLIVHSVIILFVSLAHSFQALPKIPIVWLDLDNQLGTPKQQKQEPPKKASIAHATKSSAINATKKKEKKQKAKTKKKPKKAVLKKFKTKDIALNKLSPGNAALMLLVRTDRIRHTRYERTVRRLLEVFYDHKTFLYSNQIDPLNDFDALLIATPNPYRVTQTFLAAKHRLSRAKVRRAINASGSYGSKYVQWQNGDFGLEGRLPSPPRLRHDPRRVILRDDLILLADPRRNHSLLTALEPPTPSDANEERKASILEQLKKLNQQGGKGKKGPGLLLQAINLPRLIRLPAGTPPPQSIRVSIPPTAPALVDGVIEFKSAKDASQFHKLATEQLKRASASLMLRLMGIGAIIDKTKLKTTRKNIHLRVALNEDEVKKLLELFRSFIPQVRVPGMKFREAKTQLKSLKAKK